MKKPKITRLFCRRLLFVALSFYYFATLLSSASAQWNTFGQFISPWSWFSSTGAAPTYLYNIVCDGNSLTYGSGATAYSYMLQDSLTPAANYLITNKGAPGQTIESMCSRYSGTIAPLYQPRCLKNILFYWEGTNIFLTGSDSSQIAGFFKSYYDAAKSTGWTVILFTTLPQYYAPNDAAVEAKRIALNRTLRWNSAAFCDYLIDIAADTLYGDKTDENDPAHYWDAVHITTAIHAKLASLAYTSVQGIVNGYSPETWDWAKRVVMNNGGFSTTDLRAQDTLVKLTKSIRYLFQRLNTFSGDSLDAALVPLFTGPGFGSSSYGLMTDQNYNFVNSDYSPGGGLGSLTNTNKYLNTGYNTFSAPMVSIYDYSQGVYQLGTGLESGLAMGNYGGTTSRNYFWTNYTSGSTYLAVMGAGESNKAHGGVSAGLWVDNRLNNTCQKYFNAVDFAMSNINAAASKPNMNILVFAWNNNGSPTGWYTHKSNGYFVGNSMTSSQVSTLTTAWNAHKSILNRN